MSKYTIVKKDNNGIIVGDVSFGLSTRPYLVKGELFLNDDLLIRKRKDHINKSEVLSCEHVVSKVVTSMNDNMRERFFDKLFEIEDISEVMPIVDIIINSNDSARRTNKKLFTSILIKTIVKNHYNAIINSFNNEEFNTILDNRIIDDNYEELMRSVIPEEADKVLSSDLNNLCLKAFISAIDDRYYNKDDHKCWTPCVKAEPTECQKVKDFWEEKKTIDQYPFVTEGFQLFKDGKLDKFIVLDCKNHVKSNKK